MSEVKQKRAQERSYLIEAFDRKTGLIEARQLLFDLICAGKGGCKDPESCKIIKAFAGSEEKEKSKDKQSEKANSEFLCRNILIIDSGNITTINKPESRKKDNINEDEENSTKKSGISSSNTSRLRTALFDFTSKTFAPDEYKAVIITDADKLSVQSQNTLLKILEEPPARIVFILATSKKRKLLPTILSRCIILKAKSNSKTAVADLKREFDMPEERAQIILGAANGDFYSAQRLARSDYFKTRDDMIDALDRLWELKNFATSAVEHLICGDKIRTNDKNANTEDKEEHREKSNGKKKTDKISPECVQNNLEIALIYIQDVINYKYGTAEAANTDRIDDIARHSKISGLKLTQTAEGFARLIQKMALCKGLNVKLGVTAALFDILEAVI